MVEFKSYLKRLHLLSQMEIHLIDEFGIDVFHLHNKNAGYGYRERVKFTLGKLSNYVLENTDLRNDKDEIIHLLIEELSYIITFVDIEEQELILVLGPFIYDDSSNYQEIDEVREFRKIARVDIEKIAYFMERKNWQASERQAVKFTKVEKHKLLDNERYNLISTSYECIRSNDKTESYILSLVENGDYTRLKECLHKTYYEVPEHYDLDDDKRQIKNLVLVMNTLCCRAAIKGGISSVYARSLCATIAKQVEGTNNVNLLNKLRIDIILKYCKKVQEYKLEGYSELLKKCIHYINDNISEEITLADLANHCNVSYEYLSRYIKKESGLNFLNILQKIRVENAKNLLKADFPITEITSLVGLKSTSQFCQVFKKYTGVTAKEWKANNK